MKYIAQGGKWVPEGQYRPRKGRTVYFSIVKGEYNHAFGAYTGSKQDIRDCCSKVEDETGSRPVEIGDQRIPYKPVRKEYPCRVLN